MFSGILQGVASVVYVSRRSGFSHLRVRFPGDSCSTVQIGASVSIDGVCLTAVEAGDQECAFDIVQETLDRSTLGFVKEGDLVNFERALRYGDEIGGHSVSGHVDFFTSVSSRAESDGNLVVGFGVPEKWRRYIFEKGYVAVHGASLTVASVSPRGEFTVSLIPETRRVTTLGNLLVGSKVNIEIDRLTQAIVDTVDARLKSIDVSGGRT